MEKKTESFTEFNYIINAADAFAEKHYEDALYIFREGIEQSIAAEHKTDFNEFLKMLHLLVVMIEGSLEKDFGFQLRKKARRLDQTETKCSFCGKSQKEVKNIIAGPSVRICNECVDICNEVLAGDKSRAYEISDRKEE
jgi:hypothetical protein